MWKELPAKTKKITTGVAAVAAAAGLGLGIGLPLALGGQDTLAAKGTEIAFMPNTSNLDDMSFNYETNNGFKSYGERFGYEQEVFVPNTMAEDKEIYTQTFQRIKSEGYNGILTNGFMPVDALSEWGDAGFLGANEDMYAILLDDGALANQGLTNGLSYLFNSAEAGFQAGISAGLYALAKAHSEGVAPKVNTWGGQQFGNVFDWMSGFEQAINYLNFTLLGVKPMDADRTGAIEIISAKQNAHNGSDTYSGITASSGYTQGAVNGDEKASQWFSGNFNPDTGDTPAIDADTNGAQVLFPVAGPQTGDALGTNIAAKIIGVDTDATAIPGNDSEKILGSATKNLADAAEFSMWYAERWIGDFNGSSLKMQLEGNAQDVAMFDTHMQHADAGTTADRWDTFEYTNEGYIDVSTIKETSYFDTNDASNYKSEDESANKADMFEHDQMMGDFNNGGVGYTTNGATVGGINANEWALDYLQANKVAMGITLDLDAFDSFQAFMDYSFEEQVVNGVVNIEAASPTFASTGSVRTFDYTIATTEMQNWMLPETFTTAPAA